MVKINKDFRQNYLLGIDYGDKNIGLALGKDGLVSPLKTVTAVHLPTALHEIMRLAFENKVEAFVVGLPLDINGKDTIKSMQVRQFANRLKAFSKKQVVYQSEHSTTVGATEEMIDFEISQKKRHVKDHFAAALILKRYYNEH
jgi:putative holliday junction resolvase